MSSRAIHLVLACLLPVLLGLGGAPSARADEATDEALQTADGLLAAGTPLEAVAVLQAVLDGAPEDTDRHRLEAALGETWKRAGQPYAAVKPLEAVANDRGWPSDHVALAEALLAIARQSAAGPSPQWLDVAPYLEDAIAVASEAAEAPEPVATRRQAVVGEARYLQGEMEAAAAAFETVAAEHLSTATAAYVHDLHGRALHALGRFVAAAAAFEAGGNLRGAVSAWAAARQGDRAMALMGRLLETDPGNPVLLREAYDAARYAKAEPQLAGLLASLEAQGEALGRILVVRGMLAEATGAEAAAARLYAAAAEADPAAAEPHYEQGRLHLRTGQGNEALDQAVEALLAALERNRTHERVQALLWDLAGRDYAAIWRSPSALRRTLRIQKALAAAADGDALTWANLGNTLRIAGAGQAAVDAYDRAIAADPYDPGIVSDRGLALSAVGERDLALEAFRAAAALDPDYDAAHQNAARFLWLDGQDDPAAAHLAAAERRTRARGGNWMRYRLLLDRLHRSHVRPEAR